MYILFIFLGFMMTPNEIQNNQEYLHHDEERSSESDENEAQEVKNTESKRKVYQRHTPEQIQRLEEVFQRCQRPDEQDRIRLGQELGMPPLRVKFWFQNRRTQTKNKSNQLENAQLKEDNERLRRENLMLTEALLTATCPDCGFRAHMGIGEDATTLIRMNAQLREKIDELARVVQEYYSAGAASVASSSSSSSIPFVQPTPETASRGAALGVDMQAVTDLAESAARELLAMATVKDPLWLPVGPDGTEILNEQQYHESFSGGTSFGPRPLGFATEATRAATMLPTNVYGLIDLFMDASKWAAFFFDFVSRAMTMEVLSRGRGLADGAMQVISAEYQIPTPFVPIRESFFLRYCKKLADNRTWIIVDVSLESLVQTFSTPKCRRRPSGCLIQEMPDRLLKIIWVEHVEIDDRSTHDMFKMMVSCGMAFGARRCLAIMARHFERIQCLMSYNSNQMIAPQIHTRSILRLAERMAISFNCGAAGNPRKNWIRISKALEDDVKIMGRVNIDDPGKPIGVVFCASTSFHVPLLPKIIFDYLLDDSSRIMWNILYEGGTFEKIADIPIGRGEANRVSVFYVNGVQSTHNLNRESMCVQESWSDATGSSLIYAPLGSVAVNILMTEGDPDRVPLLSSGFSIFPDGPRELTGGSLVTVSFQLHVDTNPMMFQASPQVVTAITNLVKTTEYKIKNALLGGCSQLAPHS